jgi:membrane protein
MWTAGRAARKIAKQPGAFALSVVKQFRANQGVLLGGAVAYYTLLSLVPLLILMLALSHVIPEDRLLLTLSEYLEFVVPGQSTAIVEEVRTFLAQKQVIGSILFVTMLFFSALAFTILENAMSLIFYHRVKIKRRHFLVSAVMPYLFILFLGVGLLVVTVLSGILQFVGTRSIMILGQPRSLDQVSIFLLYIVGVTGELLLLTAIYFVMPVGRLSFRHALIGGVTATILWELMRHILAWYYTTMSQIQLVYGSLTTAIAVLLSVEIGALVLLVGAQVIAEYERISHESIETETPNNLMNLKTSANAANTANAGVVQE